jgi:glycosyltransferase involved in cell wall biosynthesis
VPQPLKVLFAEPPPARRVGGIETALSGLAQALASVGVAVTRAAELTPALVAAADIVHFHGLWETAHHRARRWCLAAARPYLVSPHGMLEDWAFRHRGWKKRPYFHLVERRSLARGHVILATSEIEADTLRRWFAPEQVRVLPLGLEPPVIPAHAAARQRLGWPDDEHTVLFLSRLHEKKGLHLLVDALAAAASAGPLPPIHLVIVGEGDPAYVAPLRATTAAWRPPLRATWVGACWGAEKWDYLSAAHLMCLPSFSENFGLAVLESLFAGTPVLTTPATPWAEIRGALPVRLTEPAVPALTAALRDALAAPPPTEAQRAVTRRAAAARFAWTDLAPRYAALYRELAPSS